ncbi:MAG: cytochrome c-type bioproteinis protein [Spirochaetes bacterium]|nr:MAG: cytochrome c-type bioproteinis protein [Spirochaetota bacterium]
MNSPGILAATLAGLLSFLSPCVLPLVPAYLSYITGSTAAQISARIEKGKILSRSLAFSLGFTLAFTLMGIIFSGGAMFVGKSRSAQYIGIAGGVVVILLGLNMIFDFLKFLDADARLMGKFTGKTGKGFLGSIALGFAFAAGWSPCIGPILASILLLASREGNAAKAALLLFAYSLGFAIPFIASGLFFDRLRPLMKYLAKHGKTVRIFSGLVLVAFGAAMAAGSLGFLSAIAAQAGYSMEDFAAEKPGLVRGIGALAWTGIALAAGYPLLRRKQKIPQVQAHPQTRPRSWRRKALVLAAVGIGALEAAGMVSIVRILAAWLTFAGI